jgi:hypothetical protein
MANNTSQHILPTSANLLGFCLFVITSLHVTDRSASSVIDEFTSLIALLLTFSCLFSFFSIRAKNDVNEKRLENVADYLFGLSLIGIVIIISLLVFGVIK